MLQTSHIGIEAMSAVSSAIKDERWTDAQKQLTEVLQVVHELQHGVAAKLREILQAPEPDHGDRG